MTNKPKILVSGPVCNISGYSEHARTLVDSLMDLGDQIDLYIQDTQWAASTRSLKYLNKYSSLIDKTTSLFQSRVNEKGQINISGLFSCTYQVKPPNEFQKLSSNDIGVTAALETTSAPAEWVSKCNMMEHILVVSEHAKKNLKNTKDNSGNGISTPITVIPFGFKEKNAEADVYDEIGLETSFNFLTVLQLAPRKNFENTLRWFVEEFKDDNEVGLIIKTHMQNNSTMDFHATKSIVESLLNKISPDRKCKIYFVHGNMSEDQMLSLYNPDYIDCYLTATHGEGFGIPIFYAACNGIPVVATNWSGHLDFLRMPVKNRAGKNKIVSHFVKVDYDVAEVQQQHLMPGLITQGCKWAYPKEESFKKGLRSVRENNEKVLEDAKRLSSYLKEKNSLESVYSKYKEFNSTQIEAYETETIDWMSFDSDSDEIEEYE